MKYNEKDVNRADWIDVCRGIAILLVILGHAEPPFKKQIYGFHLALFFILSGWLMKDEGLTLMRIKKSVVRYLKPYFLLCIINLFIYSIWCHTIFDGKWIRHYLIGILYSRGTVEWMPNCSPLWFLTCFFVAIVIAYAINFIEVKLVKLLVIALCVAISWLLDVSGAPKLPWNIDSAFMGVGFLYIGKFAAAKLPKKRWENVYCKLVAVIILAVTGVMAINRNEIQVSFDGNSYGKFDCFIIGAVCISFVVIIIAIHIEQSWNKSLWFTMKFFLAKFGRHTILIMGFEFAVQTLIVKLGFSAWIMLFAMKIVSLTVMIFIWERLNYWIKYKH